MKNLISKSAAVIAIVFLFAGCVKRNYYELTAEDYEWVNIYVPTQRIVFRDTAGIQQSWTVFNTTRGYNENGKEYYGNADFTVYCDADSIKGLGRAGVYLERNATGLMAEMYFPSHQNRFDLISAAPQTDNISGIPLSDVYVSTGDTLNLDHNKFYKVYFSKSLGFIRYEEYTGRVWTLIK